MPVELELLEPDVALLKAKAFKPPVTIGYAPSPPEKP